MNIAFLDAVGWDYDVSTPYQRPLGGSQSALAYLAVELARRGSRVTVYCGTSWPRDVMGVTSVSIQNIPIGSLDQPYDALIVLNGPGDLCVRLHQHLAPTTPLVLWTQHAADQPAMQPLHQAAMRHGWDVVACVSEWHRSTMIAQYGFDPDRVCVLRNAIAPCFEGLFSSREDLVRAKTSELILSYTSTPFRGLNVLIHVFPELRRAFPEVWLDVFSSMKVYQQNEAGDEHAPLYHACRQTEGVRYRGSVPQPRLAEALMAASILAYPNTFAETSCIAVMEAMATGLLVVTTDMGALPETTMGFADMVPPPTGPAGVTGFVQGFFDHLSGAIRNRAADAPGFAAARFEQVQAVNASCTWRARAIEWEEAIRSWKEARIATPRAGLSRG
jgi:glycosyltransferase involved in cell wall biosynthesis